MNKTECSCDRCIKACANGNPGWFLPGEAEKAAELLGINFDEFKRQYLVIDFWCTPDGDCEVLAPAKVNTQYLGRMVSWGYAFEKGRCVFLNEQNLCRIHKAKPFECAVMDCKSELPNKAREFISQEWKIYRNKPHE